MVGSTHRSKKVRKIQFSFERTFDLVSEYNTLCACVVVFGAERSPSNSLGARSVHVRMIQFSFERTYTFCACVVVFGEETSPEQ